MVLKIQGVAMNSVRYNLQDLENEFIISSLRAAFLVIQTCFSVVRRLIKFKM